MQGTGMFTRLHCGGPVPYVRRIEILLQADGAQTVGVFFAQIRENLVAQGNAHTPTLTNGCAAAKDCAAFHTKFGFSVHVVIKAVAKTH